MSFILDALKKSEIERQRQTIPGLVEPGTARPRKRLPAWAIALAALLAINLVVLIVMLARGFKSASGPGPAQSGHKAALAAAPAPSSAPGSSSTSARSSSSSPGNDHFSPLDPAPVYAPEIPVAGAGSPAAIQQPLSAAEREQGSAQPFETPREVARPTHRGDPLLTDQDSQAETEEVLPSINELNLSGDQAMPELHLDVHVYATKPSERFVYVNMRKYREGATLAEGPTLERIRRDGVVLNYQGLRFLLPRQ